MKFTVRTAAPGEDGGPVRLPGRGGGGGPGGPGWCPSYGGTYGGGPRPPTFSSLIKIITPYGRSVNRLRPRFA